MHFIKIFDIIYIVKRKRENKKSSLKTKNVRLAKKIIDIENNANLTEKEKFDKIDMIIQELSEEDFFEIDNIIHKINKKII